MEMISDFKLYQENSFIIDHLLRVINLAFIVNNEFYPIAVSIDFNNKINEFESVKLSFNPTIEEILVKQEKKLNHKLKTGKIKAYCIAVDVLTSKTIESLKTSAIAFLLKSNKQNDTEILYCSYILKGDCTIVITDVWSENEINQLS